MSKLSTERAIDALDTVRAYYASLTAGYPKGKDCKAVGDVMCSEIANSCLMAIKALEQEPCTDVISRQAAIDCLNANFTIDGKENMETVVDYINGAFKQIKALPSVTPQQRVGRWIIIDDCEKFIAKCSECGRKEDSRMISKFPYCPNCGAKMERSDK